jgi:hypothetical protein
MAGATFRKEHAMSEPRIEEITQHDQVESTRLEIVDLGDALLEIEEEGQSRTVELLHLVKALLSIRNEAELNANVEIIETWKLVIAAWFDDEAIASEVLFPPSEELWTELTAFGGQAMCPPGWKWIVDGGWAKCPLQINISLNGAHATVSLRAVGAWEWDATILRIVVKHCAKRKFTGSTSDLFPLVRRILATWNTTVFKVARWHGFVEQTLCHLYASLLYLQWQYSLAHDPHPELAEEARLSGQGHFFKLLGVNAPPTVALTSVASLGQALEEVMRAPPVEISHTAGFRGRLHDKLLQQLGTILRARLPDTPRISILQSLQDHGCDQLIEWPGRAKCGVQLKNNGDVEKEGFAAHTVAQIQDSRQHGLAKLYVILAADMTGNSNLQKSALS